MSQFMEVLEWFDLSDAADRPARTYSGGMRRRLDLAASLIARPADSGGFSRFDASMAPPSTAPAR